MAVMNTLREKFGKIVLIFIAGAMVAFILSDVFGSGGSSIFSGSDDVIGEIAGSDIKQDEYRAEIDRLSRQFQMQTGRTPDDRYMVTIRQQAWDKLIAQKAFQKEYEALGIQITAEEHEDMLFGTNVSPFMLQQFTNPETQEFERSKAEEFVNRMASLAQLPDNDPNKFMYGQWAMIEEEMDPSRIRLKYERMLINSNMVTEAEAKQEYHRQTDVAEAKVLYVPFTAISDSISISESDINAYYQEHKKQYKIDESRDLKYVNFNIVASTEDTAAVVQEMKDLVSEFKNTDNDSTFAKYETDATGPAFFQQYFAPQLPEVLKNNLAILSEGSVYGPFQENGMLRNYKVSKIVEDSVFNARASHILFKFDSENEESKALAKTRAQETLDQIIAGQDFAQLARANSEDQANASRGGDLGWIPENKMVAPFNDAIFNKSTKGLINTLVETKYGYHIINVTEDATKTIYKIASVDREILPSTQTRDQFARDADTFANAVSDVASLEKVAEENGYVVYDAINLRAADRRVGQLGEARQLVSWTFNESKLDKVSEVEEINDSYVIAVIAKVTEKGYASLESVRDQVEDKVRQEKQGEQIASKLNGINGATLKEIADAFGSDANVYSTSDLKLSSNNIPGVGYSPKTVGLVFGMEEGKKSKPIAVENGVVMILLEGLTIAPEIADYSNYKNQLEQLNKNKTTYNINSAITDAAEIEDKRYKFQ